MNEPGSEIRQSIWKIINANQDFINLFNEQKLNFEEHNNSWFQRLDDIYNREAPATITKLILELRLVDKYNVSFYINTDTYIIPAFSALRSIDDFSNEWKNALKDFIENIEVNRLIKQLDGLAPEMIRALNNIRMDNSN